MPKEMKTKPSPGAYTPGVAALKDVSFSGVAQGDLFYRGASLWNNLPHGVSGQVLQTNGAAANPSWTTSVAGDVTLTPSTTTRNLIQPTADNISPLILKWHSATQSEPFLICQDDTGTTKASINLTGEFQGRNVRLFQTDVNGSLISGNAANSTTAGVAAVNIISNADGSGNALNNWQVLTDASFLWQSKTTTTFRTQAAIIPSWRDNTDATRAARMSFQLRGTGPASPLIEALNLSVTGASSPMIGFLGGAAVVQQANASQAAITAVIDPNAKSALQAIYNLLTAYTLAPATA